MTRLLRTSILGMASAAAIAWATAGSALADGLGSDFDAAKAGDQTLTLWWLSTVSMTIGSNLSVLFNTKYSIFVNNKR